jgi:WD40 repeat protein
MSEPQQESLTQRVVPIDAGTHVIRAQFLGEDPTLALADGRILTGGAGAFISPHGDAAILLAACNGIILLTGGDDGKVIATTPGGTSEILGDEKGRWIDALAIGPSGSVAWSTGKKVVARDGKGERKEWTAPSTAQGLVFSPKGYRIAISHYNGVSLWFPNTAGIPEVREWKGSHLDVTLSPDGRFLVTSMQENMLHGWRLADGKDMRMSGYPSKTRSFSWSHDGHWLATSGADAAIIWPFKDKEGPMGKAPRECGVRHSKVSAVAFHPRALVVAIGYEDSCILLCRLTDGAELLVRPATKEGGKVTSMGWNRTGNRMIFGTEEGAAGVLTLP